MRRDTVCVSREWPLDHHIGLLHIDASHEYADARKDFEFWSPFVMKGGFIVFDDVPLWPGPSRLITELPNWFQYVDVSGLKLTGADISCNNHKVTAIVN